MAPFARARSVGEFSPSLRQGYRIWQQWPCNSPLCSRGRGRCCTAIAAKCDSVFFLKRRRLAVQVAILMGGDALTLEANAGMGAVTKRLAGGSAATAIGSGALAFSRFSIRRGDAVGAAHNQRAIRRDVNMRG
jgi:hypothetical protein